MIRTVGWSLLCISLSATFVETEGARILGLLTYKGKSHNILTLPLFAELAKRGHDVTVVGFHEIPNPPPNYRTILLDRVQTTEFLSFDDVYRPSENFAAWSMEQLYNLTLSYPEVLHNPALRTLLGQRFDLVITEYFNSDAFLGLIYLLKAPYVFFHTAEPTPWHKAAMGDPLETSYSPHILTVFDRTMDFKGRFWNFVETFWILFVYETQFRWRDELLTAPVFNPEVPLKQIARNASLYLTNTHFSLHGVRPMNSATIQVGGINILPAEPLAQDLKKILDDAHEGIIYFSMGSVLKGQSLDNKRRDAFAKVFSERKETVLWKWEGDFPNKPKNLHTSKWFPQRDIFAHPNMKLYIGHGGIHGVHEAVTEALPTLCIPMFGDQPFNCKRIQVLEMGLGLNFQDLNEDVIRTAINDIISNPRYKKNAVKVSAAFKDRPMSAMDTAVYWTEYVIRHKGAPHLKSPARNLSWIEYYNLDVIALIITALLTLIFIFVKCLAVVWRLVKPVQKVKTS